MKRIPWSKKSWQKHPVLQQPDWPDRRRYEHVLSQLSHLPALVFAGETRELKRRLAEAEKGESFILQAGHCSEEFSDCNGPRIHRLLKVILQMSVILAYSGRRRIVNVGRVAGQCAKPRSSDVERVNGNILPSFRGDMVNGREPTLAARRPDPARMLEGYFRATATLNLIRAFTMGGYSSLDMLHAWHQDFLAAFGPNSKYERLVMEIQKALDFSRAIGGAAPSLQENHIVLYTSHEALLLGFEEALTRVDTTTGDWYDTSAHMLWIGDRTRQLDGAHVEFLRGVGNPIGIKIGCDHEADDIKRVIERLNPDNQSGKIALITRLGSRRVGKLLPPLIRAVRREGMNVAWLSDPMHGNTFTNPRGVKTRRFRDIVSEARQFLEIHAAEKTHAGGVHLELTGENVTECLGGFGNIGNDDLARNYQSPCDPRLNAPQAVEFAFELSRILNA